MALARNAEDIAKLTLDRRLEREEEKEGKSKKRKCAGNKDWVEGMPSPNPTGRPKGVKNKFSKRTRNQVRRIFEQYLYDVEIGREKATLNQKLKALEVFAKFVLEEKKILKAEVKHTQSIIIDVTGEFQETKSNQIEDAKFYLEEAEEENI